MKVRLSDKLLVETLMAQSRFGGLFKEREERFARSLIEHYNRKRKLSALQDERAYNLMMRVIHTRRHVWR